MTSDQSRGFLGPSSAFAFFPQKRGLSVGTTIRGPRPQQTILLTARMTNCTTHHGFYTDQVEELLKPDLAVLWHYFLEADCTLEAKLEPYVHMEDTSGSRDDGASFALLASPSGFWNQACWWCTIKLVLVVCGQAAVVGSKGSRVPWSAPWNSKKGGEMVDETFRRRKLIRGAKRVLCGGGVPRHMHSAHPGNAQTPRECCEGPRICFLLVRSEFMDMLRKLVPVASDADVRRYGRVRGIWH